LRSRGSRKFSPIPRCRVCYACDSGGRRTDFVFTRR
jgi:hypothetical protein